jgi:hypothetical protein
LTVANANISSNLYYQFQTLLSTIICQVTLQTLVVTLRH